MYVESKFLVLLLLSREDGGNTGFIFPRKQLSIHRHILEPRSPSVFRSHLNQLNVSHRGYLSLSLLNNLRSVSIDLVIP